MQKYEITLSVASFNKTTTISQPDDIDIHNFLDTCRSLAIAAGYHENSWKDAVVEMANEYLIEEENQTNKQLDEVLAQHKVYTGKSNLTTHWGPLNTTDC
jgi:hypothetical protein